MEWDISLRTAYAIQRQGKRIFSPLDSKAFICLLASVLFALEEEGAVRLEPAEPAHHGLILPRHVAEKQHLQLFYTRAVNRNILAFFENCTATGEELEEENEAFAHYLEQEDVRHWNEMHIQKLADNKAQDPTLVSLLDVCDLGKGLFIPPAFSVLTEDRPEKPGTNAIIEVLPLLWMLRFVQ